MANFLDVLAATVKKWPADIHYIRPCYNDCHKAWAHKKGDAFADHHIALIPSDEIPYINGTRITESDWKAARIRLGYDPIPGGEESAPVETEKGEPEKYSMQALGLDETEITLQRLLELNRSIRTQTEERDRLLKRLNELLS